MKSIIRMVNLDPWCSMSALPTPPVDATLPLDQAPLGTAFEVLAVGGSRSFRRRLMELGLLPGAMVERARGAPLGDPIELRVLGASLSVRRAEAHQIQVRPLGSR